MIRSRLRLALGATVSLALLELGLTQTVTNALAMPLANATSAFLDPRRVGPAATELGSKLVTMMKTPILVVATLLVVSALLEPLLSVAYVRAHVKPLDRLREPATVLQSALGLIGVRVVVTIAVGVVLAMLSFAYTALHVATRGGVDPRWHTIPSILIVGFALATVSVAYVWLELASVDASLSKPRPFEALLVAYRRLRFRTALLRFGLLAASLATGVLVVLCVEATCGTRAAPLFAMPMVVVATLLRLGLRSTWLAYATEMDAREPD